jgi:uncharacterized phage infection (PIP) family protein YhgE
VREAARTAVQVQKELGEAVAGLSEGVRAGTDQLSGVVVDLNGGLAAALAEAMDQLAGQVETSSQWSVGVAEAALKQSDDVLRASEQTFDRVGQSVADVYQRLDAVIARDERTSDLLAAHGDALERLRALEAGIGALTATASSLSSQNVRDREADETWRLRDVAAREALAAEAARQQGALGSAIQGLQEALAASTAETARQQGALGSAIEGLQGTLAASTAHMEREQRAAAARRSDEAAELSRLVGSLADTGLMVKDAATSLVSGLADAHRLRAEAALDGSDRHAAAGPAEDIHAVPSQRSGSEPVTSNPDMS